MTPEERKKLEQRILELRREADRIRSEFPYMNDEEYESSKTRLMQIERELMPLMRKCEKELNLYIVKFNAEVSGYPTGYILDFKLFLKHELACENINESGIDVKDISGSFLMEYFRRLLEESNGYKNVQINAIVRIQRPSL